MKTVKSLQGESLRDLKNLHQFDLWARRISNQTGAFRIGRIRPLTECSKLSGESSSKRNYPVVRLINDENDVVIKLIFSYEIEDLSAKALLYNYNAAARFILIESVVIENLTINHAWRDETSKNIITRGVLHMPKVTEYERKLCKEGLRDIVDRETSHVLKQMIQ